MKPTQEIITGNKMIADYAVKNLAWKELNDGRYYFSFFSEEPTTKCPPEHLSFHKYWNWLMPIIIKINQYKYQDGDTAYLKTFGMMNAETGKPMARFNRHRVFEADTLIEATWNAVIDFIEWQDSATAVAVTPNNTKPNSH